MLNFLSILSLADSSQVSMIDSVLFDKLVSVRSNVLHQHAPILDHRSILLDKFEGTIDHLEGYR